MIIIYIITFYFSFWKKNLNIKFNKNYTESNSENNKKQMNLNKSLPIPRLYENIGKDRLKGLTWNELEKKYQTNRYIIRKALIEYKLTNPDIIYPKKILQSNR